MNKTLLWLAPGVGLVLAAGGAAGAFAGCGSSSSGSGGSGSLSGNYSSMPIVGPDVPLPPGVNLQPDVVVVHGGGSVLKSVSSDNGTWTIDKNAMGASALAAGNVLLIAGVDCARVTALTDNGDGTLNVTVEPVAIVDVIQDGMFDWDSSGIDPSVGVLGQTPYSIVVQSETADAGDTDGAAGEGGCGDAGADGGVPTCSSNLHAQALIGGLGGNPTNTVSITVGSWQLSFSGGVSGGSLSLSGTASWNVNQNAPTPMPMSGDPAATLGGINTGVTFGVVVNNVKSTTGSVGVSGGTISSASMQSDVSGSATVGATMSNQMANQYPKQALLKIPLSVEYPIFWGPIPFYVSYSLAFLIQPSLSSQMSVLGVSTTVSFSGKSGFSFSGGTATPMGGPSIKTPDNPLNTANTPSEIGTMAVVVALQGPRVGFGIGTTAFAVGARAGVYVDVVNALGLTVASSTDIAPCRSITWNGSAHGGGEFAIKSGATVGVTHQIDLLNLPQQLWYDPMIPVCKP